MFKFIKNLMHKTNKTNTSYPKFESNNYGRYNTGSHNIGSYNTGHCNNGSGNAGSYNIGHDNAGRGNIGSFDSGCDNCGDFNSGNSNIGNKNAGHCNHGNNNTGDWNATNNSTGFFNSKPQPIYMFNKPVDLEGKHIWDFKGVRVLHKAFRVTCYVPFEDMTSEEKAAHPEYGPDNEYGGYMRKVDYKTACKQAWDALNDDERKSVTEIPNFDADVFEEITGIDARKYL